MQKNSKNSALLAIALSLAIHGFFFPPTGWADTRGIVPIPVKDKAGNNVVLYKESHALVIGVSDYTAGWPDLETIPSEINAIEAALFRQGFHVVKVLNPTSRELKKSFEDFINQYGYSEDNRLLFFFSGHGYTRKDGKKGYVVPADAPNPLKDEMGFLQKSLGMGQILTWARDIEAKHALFLFDSCFSGAIFKTRALPKHPRHISAKTSRPVRQFITAGSAGEEVPARSVFAPTFIRAIDGEADLNRDGYVTGEELGMYLHDKIIDYGTGQTPQYGKIRDPDLDEGDYVFPLNLASIIATPKTPSIQPAPPPTQSVESAPPARPSPPVAQAPPKRPDYKGGWLNRPNQGGWFGRRSKPMISKELQDYIKSSPKRQDNAE